MREAVGSIPIFSRFFFFVVAVAHLPVDHLSRGFLIKRDSWSILFDRRQLLKGCGQL